MKTKLIVGCIVAVAGVAYGAAVMAQVKPRTLVRQREAAMMLMGKYFYPMNAMATGKAPYNAARVVTSAAYLDVLAKMPWDGFTADAKDEKSHALPEVYSTPAKFKEAIDALQRATATLAKVSKGSDEAAVKAAITEVDKACGSCHDNFRAE